MSVEEEFRALDERLTEAQRELQFAMWEQREECRKLGILNVQKVSLLDPKTGNSRQWTLYQFACCGWWERRPGQPRVALYLEEIRKIRDEHQALLGGIRCELREEGAKRPPFTLQRDPLMSFDMATYREPRVTCCADVHSRSLI